MAKKSYRTHDELQGFPEIYEKLKLYDKPRYKEGDIVELNICGGPRAGKWKALITDAYHSVAFYSQYHLTIIDEKLPQGWVRAYFHFEDYAEPTSNLTPFETTKSQGEQQ